MNYNELKEIAQELELTHLEGLAEAELLAELEGLDVIKTDDHTGEKFDATQGYYFDESDSVVTESLANMAKYWNEDPEEFEAEYKRKWDEEGGYHIFWTETTL